MKRGHFRFLAGRGLACALLESVVACGGGSPAVPPPPTPAPPTTTLAPATLADLSASVTSPQAGRQINCRSSVRAVVTLSSRAASDVTLTGIEKKSRITQGPCDSADDFTYGPAVSRVAPGESAVVMDKPLYFPGTGCCFPGSACDGRTTCRIQETLAVLTSVGSVPAGSLAYRVNFNDCGPCEAASAGRRSACLPAVR